MGDYVDLSGILDESLGGKFAKIYEVVDLPTPTYDQSTGGYNYELRLDAYYWKWKIRNSSTRRRWQVRKRLGTLLPH